MQTQASKEIARRLEESEDQEIRDVHALINKALEEKELEELEVPSGQPALALMINAMFYMLKQVTVSKSNKKVITVKVRQLIDTYHDRAGSKQFIHP